MTVGEFVGYVASVLTFSTFYMKTMVPLRLVGILSNFAFIAYSLLEDLVPVTILHSTLLCLNIYRLHQIMRMVAEVRAAATGDLALEVLLPFMTRRRFKAGETLFRRGDASHEMYYIRDGVIRLDEIGKRISQNDVLGEISLFSPGKQRTVTAVCETNGELLRMSDEQVLRLYHQNPKFGFHIVQLITRRLIENYEARTTEQGPLEVGLEGRGPSGEAPYQLSDKRPLPASSSAPAGRSRRTTRYYLVGGLSAAVVLATYAGWSLAPYLSSTMFRDAAVTTWINLATAPIRGNLDGPLPPPGERVGTDGRLTVVRNLQADRSGVESAAAEVARAEAQTTELQAYLAAIRQLDMEWQQRTADYAATFKRNLELEIEGTKRELDFLGERLTLEHALAERIRTLALRGGSSQSAADESLAQVMELERQRAEGEKMLARAEERQRAADRGVFLLADGRNPEWAYESRDRLRLEVAQATRALAEAEAELAKARISAEAMREAFELILASPVLAPPESLVWSTVAGAGAAVDVGTPVAGWIDCSVMLVDVPAHDVEIGLLRPGMLANILIEGEAQLRQGTVLLTRGAASTLGDADLAATAKGRDAGLGQVIVTLAPTPEDVRNCAIGTAAWVDFPEIDLIDILRARLRL